METTNHKTIILIVHAKTPAIERTAVSSRTRGNEKTIKNIFCFLHINTWNCTTRFAQKHMWHDIVKSLTLKDSFYSILTRQLKHEFREWLLINLECFN